MSEPLSEQVAPRNAMTRRAYESVRRAIMSGELPPGAPLRERQLAARLGVSRTPVREALAMLEGEELAILSSAGQLAVREVTVADIREAYSVRVVLEGYGARLAAETRSEDDLRRLRLLNEELRDSFRAPDVEQDVARQTRLDSAFHKGIGAASGNKVLARIIGLLIDTPIRERAFFWFSRRRHLLSVRHHARVLDALEKRDAAEAERLLQEHVRLGGESLAKYLTKIRQAEREDALWTNVASGLSESSGGDQIARAGELLRLVEAAGTTRPR